MIKKKAVGRKSTDKKKKGSKSVVAGSHQGEKSLESTQSE
jgi:hypothetical protein